MDKNGDSEGNNIVSFVFGITIVFLALWRQLVFQNGLQCQRCLCNETSFVTM